MTIADTMTMELWFTHSFSQRIPKQTFSEQETIHLLELGQDYCTTRVLYRHPPILCFWKEVLRDPGQPGAFLPRFAFIRTHSIHRRRVAISLPIWAVLPAQCRPVDSQLTVGCLGGGEEESGGRHFVRVCDFRTHDVHTGHNGVLFHGASGRHDAVG
jgi:hypothetical protein